MAVDRDGNIRGARRLGFLDRPKTAKSSLRPASDINDYYSFNLSARSSVSVSVTNFQQNINLGLLDSTGKSVAFSRKPGTQAESITRTLDAGLYYVRVALFGTSTDYSLRAAATVVPVPSPSPTPGVTPSPTPGVTPSPSPTPTIPGSGQPNQPLPAGPAPITPSPDPGPLPALAFNTGVLNTVKVYQNVVGGVDQDGNGVLERNEIDPSDYYSFTLNNAAQVRILSGNVSGGSINTSLIFDLNGNGAVDSNDTIATGNTITKSLGQGTYFVGVDFGGGGNTTYNLRLEQTPITDINFTPDPFIGLGGARDLGALPNNALTSFRQFVGSVDAIDVYKFTLTGDANTFSLLLDTTQLTGNVTVSVIYDVDGNKIANPTRKAFDASGAILTSYGDFVAGTFTGGGAGGAALVVNETLGRGDYYVAVTQKGITENTTYDLSLFTSSITLSPGGDPLATLPTSTAVTPLDTRNAANYDPVNYRQFTQFVGATDAVDTYRFTLTETRNVIVSYRGTPRTAALRLVKDRDSDGIIDVSEDGTGVAIVAGVATPFGQRNGILDTEDRNGNGVLDPGVDLNGDNVLDIPAEDSNNNGVLDTEDRNGNRVLDILNDVLEPEPTISTRPPFNETPVEYNPLPPFPLPANEGFVYPSATNGINAYLTSVPTLVYARLTPGTYFFQVDAGNTAVAVDLGDGVQRLGPGNILYNLSFFLEP